MFVVKGEIAARGWTKLHMLKNELDQVSLECSLSRRARWAERGRDENYVQNICIEAQVRENLHGGHKLDVLKTVLKD
jgi:hypothetical protein